MQANKAGSAVGTGRSQKQVDKNAKIIDKEKEVDKIELKIRSRARVHSVRVMVRSAWAWHT